jgi:hypothetical protein
MVQIVLTMDKIHCPTNMLQGGGKQVVPCGNFEMIDSMSLKKMELYDYSDISCKTCQILYGAITISCLLPPYLMCTSANLTK